MAEIYINQDADDKLSAYLRAVAGEISGFGTGKNEGNLFIIDDIFILPQEAGKAHTELDEDAMQNLLWQMIQDGKDPESVCVWWHSHGNGASFMSNTDDATVDMFADYGRPWMISIVSNCKLEHKCQIDFYKPVRAGIEDVTIKRIPSPNNRLVKRIEKEIEKKVRKPPPIPKKNNAVVVSGPGGPEAPGYAGLYTPAGWHRGVYGDGKKEGGDSPELSVGDTVLFLDADMTQKEGTIDGFLENPPRVRIKSKMGGNSSPTWFVPASHLVKISGPEEAMLTAGSGGRNGDKRSRNKKRSKKGGR